MTASLPAAPTRLGALATVPFIAGAVLVWTVDADARPALAQALSAYAAVVVAFIGAIHWGLAFARPPDQPPGQPPTQRPIQRPATAAFVWGIVPSLVAWVGVLAVPRIGLGLHAVTLIACYAVDRSFYPRFGAAAWLPLRLRLTLVATVCCLVGAAGT